MPAGAALAPQPPHPQPGSHTSLCKPFQGDLGFVARSEGRASEIRGPRVSPAASENRFGLLGAPGRRWRPAPSQRQLWNAGHVNAEELTLRPWVSAQTVT